MTRLNNHWIAVLLAGLLSSGVAALDNQNEGTVLDVPSFQRMADDDNGDPMALQVAIVRYQPADGSDNSLSVDLISAVHVGDLNYYQELNRRFQDYDAVLYELVLPDSEIEDDKLPAEQNAIASDADSEPQFRGQPANDGETQSPADEEVPTNIGNELSFNLISFMQGGMRDVLGLTYQLEEIDYSPGNMVHADMTVNEFNASMNERGESMFRTFVKMWRAGMRESLRRPPSFEDFGIFTAWFSSNRELALKRTMARDFIDMEVLERALSEGDGTTLLTERNKKAMQVLHEEIDRGSRQIAIFYGAAHMQDLGRRLSDELGLQPVNVTWIDAWNLRE